MLGQGHTGVKKVFHDIVLYHKSLSFNTGNEDSVQETHQSKFDSEV